MNTTLTAGIIGITALCCVSLATGHDGLITTAAISAITAITGYSVGKHGSKCSRIKKKR